MKCLRIQIGLSVLLASAISPATALSQIPSAPDIPARAIYGSVTATPRPTSTMLPLSLDEAIHRGLEHNLQIALATTNQRAAAGERLEAVSYLLPTITWQAQRSRRQINLEAQGFRPSLLASFPPGVLTPAQIAGFQPKVTVNEVQANATLRGTLFDLRSFELYRAAKQEIRAVDFSFLSVRGAVIQTVAGSYLLALADQANVANARGLLATNAEILRQATLKHQAGTVAKIDELRARVQYQQQQQAVIARQNEFEKSKVALNREIGLPADQSIRLTDQTPYAGLQVMPLDQALRLAYANRQEYLRLQAKLRSAQLQSHAARYQRLPTLTFTGNYGITGTVGGIYHGTFLAQGSLNIPLFKEAKFRGDRDVARAQTAIALAQLASFHTEIEAQIRTSMLDVSATEQLVTVARSNVDLVRTSLSDATERFQNGIEDNLPVVQAQSSLATAQTQLVNSLYRYDIAKLALARSVGIIDRDYRTYLGPALPAMPPITSTAALALDRLGHPRLGVQPPAEQDQHIGQ
ncbi:MAG: TolC family protein [Acidobacteriaceae bacterium]